MTTKGSAFEAFLERREKAAGAYVSGDPEPLGAMAAENCPASFFGPAGGIVLGAAEVAARYREDASRFGAEGTSRFEIFEAAADGGLAFWSGLQHARVRMREAPEPQDMLLRVTEVFRIEDGAWKLVHRHADPLVATTPPALGPGRR